MGFEQMCQSQKYPHFGRYLQKLSFLPDLPILILQKPCILRFGSLLLDGEKRTKIAGAVVENGACEKGEFKKRIFAKGSEISERHAAKNFTNFVHVVWITKNKF